MTIEGREIAWFPAERSGAPLVVVNAEAGEGAALREAIRAGTSADFSLAAIEDVNWDDELTPWPAPSIFGGRPDWRGGADGYLELLTRRLLPKLAERLDAPPGYAALAGYSLAGLFALYAMYRTDIFARFASASGSVWYPGFAEYAQRNAPVRRPDRIYLSLGDREARTKNAVMRTVEEHTRRLYAHYGDLGIETAFELNPGGHFNQPTQRLARAVAWILED